MSSTSLAVCRVDWYDSDEHEERTEYVVIQAKDYYDAVDELEEYYGDDIITMEITLIEPGPLLIGKELADKIICGDTF